MRQVNSPFNLTIFSGVSIVDWDNNSYFDLFECEYVGATTCSSVNTLELVLWVHRLRRNRSSPYLLHSLAEPYLFGLGGSHSGSSLSGSDRSCCLPRLNLVSEAVLCSSSGCHITYLLCSLRVGTHSALLIVFFSKSCFFSNQIPTLSNPGQGPEQVALMRFTPLRVLHYRTHLRATCRPPYFWWNAEQNAQRQLSRPFLRYMVWLHDD